MPQCIDRSLRAREQSGIAERRAAPARAILRLELVERSLELLEEVLLFRKDGQVDRARAGRGGGPVLVSVELVLEILVDLDLHRYRYRCDRCACACPIPCYLILMTTYLP